MIRVFDIGETEEGDLYLMLERLPAVTLAGYLDALPLDERMALEMIRQLAQLFAHLHDEGVTPLGMHDGVLYLEERDGTVALKIGSLPFADAVRGPRTRGAHGIRAWGRTRECDEAGRGRGADR